jgi:hypothetical protein
LQRAAQQRGLLCIKARAEQVQALRSAAGCGVDAQNHVDVVNACGGSRRLPVSLLVDLTFRSWKERCSEQTCDSVRRFQAKRRLRTCAKPVTGDQTSRVGRQSAREIPAQTHTSDLLFDRCILQIWYLFVVLR